MTETTDNLTVPVERYYELADKSVIALDAATRQVARLIKERDDQESETYTVIQKILKIRTLLTMLEVALPIRMEIDSIIGRDILRLGDGGNA